MSDREKAIPHFPLFSIAFFLNFFLFRAAPVAYGSSPARGRSYSCQPTPQPQQRRILNPLSETREQVCILMDASWAPYR